ncbi:lipase-like domain-containing protein [Staphylococcus aureus]
MERMLQISAGNEALVRQIVFDIGKMFGNKNSRVDLRVGSMGLKDEATMNHTLIMSNALNNLIYGNEKIMDFTI